MKKTTIAGALAAPLLMFALTLSSHADPTACKDGTTSSSTGRGACSGHGGVQKGTSGAGATAPAATPSTAEPAATTTCKDGTASATSGRGACSGHGGVQKAAKPKPTTTAGVPASAAATATATTPAAKPPSASKSAPTATAGNTDPAGATAKCKDGTYSKAKNHRGACSHHGGVAEWLTGAQ